MVPALFKSWILLSWDSKILFVFLATEEVLTLSLQKPKVNGFHKLSYGTDGSQSLDKSYFLNCYAGKSWVIPKLENVLNV